MIEIKVTGLDKVNAELDRAARAANREQRRRVVLLLLGVAAVIAGGIWGAIRIFGK